MIWCLFFFSLVKSQSTSFGWLPAINLNKKFNSGYKLNFKSESRQSIYKNETFEYGHDLIDFSLIASAPIGLGQSIAGGYLIRFRDTRTIHRSIQQFVVLQKLTGFRLAHRFSSDQTFEDQEEMVFRFRYRISSQFSLQGQSVDTKEFYLKVNNEYLNAFQNNNYDLEIRIVTVLGYEFNDNNKLEFGLDNRFDSFLNAELRNRSWWSMVWYLGF